jgi:hypothetical protein
MHRRHSFRACLPIHHFHSLSSVSRQRLLQISHMPQNDYHMARIGSHQPKVVNNDNECSTALVPWSLSTILRFSSDTHDATTRDREWLAKIASQGCANQHAECARLTKMSPGLRSEPRLKSAGIHVRVSSLVMGGGNPQ